MKNNLKAKRAGGIAQVVEHLPSHTEALSSNLVPSIDRKIQTYVKICH
jgi:hypothetical protein